MKFDGLIKFLVSLSLILVLVGAIAWGVVGVANRNIVEESVGYENSKHVYNLVGVAGLFLAVLAVVAAVTYKKPDSGKYFSIFRTK